MSLPKTELLNPSRLLSPASLVLEQTSPPPPRTVLLAEDNDDLRFVMECTLTAMGYRVVACADAELASAAFRSHLAIDLLLTDFEMPGRSGLELARELTTLRVSLPVIVLTGATLSLQALQVIRDRRWVYMSKPCHLSELEATLKKSLSFHHARDAG